MCVQSSNFPLKWFLRSAKAQFGLLVGAALMAILLANATGYGYLQQTPPIGKISMKAVSWPLAKKLAEPDAGLRGRKVTVLNPADQTVIASGTTDRAGLIEFEIPQGTYTLLGASDEPQKVQVQAGQTVKFKLIVH
jgi:hypothetical protein